MYNNKKLKMLASQKLNFLYFDLNFNKTQSARLAKGIQNDEAKKTNESFVVQSDEKRFCIAESATESKNFLKSKCKSDQATKYLLGQLMESVVENVFESKNFLKSKCKSDQKTKYLLGQLMQSVVENVFK